MKLSIFLTQLIAIACCALPALAIEDDIVMRALVDELDRTTHNLHLGVHPPPYFTSYAVKEIYETTFSSSLGSEPVSDHTHERILTPIVRVGDHILDSSYPLTSRVDYSYVVSIDDDYAALRRWAWVNTDRTYKMAVRVLDWKKAYLSANNAPERLPDLTEESPVVAINPIQKLNCDDNKWMQTVQQLSTIFKNYPTLQKSKVSFLARTINRWYVNSEGTRVRDSRTAFALKVWANAQAADGMLVSDYDIVAGTEESQLPTPDELRKRTEELAQRVTALRVAPRGEEYCGPVYFEGQAAAELFSQVMAANFGFAEEYIGSEEWRNPLKNAIGRKILPKHMNVIDNPHATDGDGRPLLGTYNYDDEGMPAKKVVLVENGLLKGFCQSRLPTRHNFHSNGHSLGGHGVYSVLEVGSSKTASPEEIKTQLTELAKDAGLDYVLVISRIKDNVQMTEYPSAQNREKRPYQTPSYSEQPSNPMAVHKLYLADGRKELIRGLEFRNVSLRALRDIQAIGADARPYIIEPNDFYARALIIPSYVIGELEMTPELPEHSTTPILASPLTPAGAH